MVVSLQSKSTETKADRRPACQQKKPPVRRRSLTALFLAAVIGYVVGSFSTADVAARLARGNGTDLRREGSGNPGAINAGSVLGHRWGYLVLVVDVLKGAAASYLGRAFAGDDGAYVAGAAAVAGHAYPPFRGFRGGKGVATSLGTTLVCMPAYAPLDVVVAAVSYGAASNGSRGADEYVDTGSPAWAGTFAAASTFVLAALAMWGFRWRVLWGPKPSVLLPAYAVVVSGVIFVRTVTGRGASSRR
ncbi:MAG: glycerol-3-phosphate acyltransferase [Chloroflexi bacterium]|nr:glycerol-3-phosphate acyltransferase [Chloroflexota bacterium]